MSNQAFSISVFLFDGDPNGLRFIEKSNWTGKGVVCPRSRFPDVKTRIEFDKPGVYVLLGTSTDGEVSVYIGEGDPVKQRLESHFSNKDFWNTIILFTSKDDNLDKTCVQYLESRLVKLAKEAKRCVLENGNNPEEPTLSEAKLADMETFLEQMLLCYPTIGLNVFEKPQEVIQKQNLLFLKAKDIEASGYDSTEGFVVLKGSQAVLHEVPSIHHFMLQKRLDFVKQGILLETPHWYVMAQNYIFDSPSTAAGVLLGKSINGREVWKDENGRTLKEIQLARIERD